MAQARTKRRQFFVDPKVQGPLAARVILYWFICLITVSLMLLVWSVVRTPRPLPMHLEQLWFHFGPALIAALVLLPMVITDIIRVSNRFAGPLVRLRRSMRALARGEPVEPIRFREGDFWQSFAEEFNAVVARVQELESQLERRAGSNEPAAEQPEDDSAASAAPAGTL